jgi:hypothetical protein
LYVINNGPDHRRLEIFDPENGKFEVVADLDSVLSFGGKTRTNTESLAWIPPDRSGGSGFFLVGNKTDNRIQVLVLRPEGGVAVRGKPLRIEGLPDIGRRLSLADLSFDARSRRLLAIFSPGDLLVQIDFQGRVLETFRRLRAPAAEGLAIGPEGSLYIGCDNLGSRDRVHGTVLRFRPVAGAVWRWQRKPVDLSAWLQTVDGDAGYEEDLTFECSGIATTHGATPSSSFRTTTLSPR